MSTPMHLLEHPQRCRVRCKSAHPKARNSSTFLRVSQSCKAPSSGALGPVEESSPLTHAHGDHVVMTGSSLLLPWWGGGVGVGGCQIVFQVLLPTSVNQTWDLKDRECPPKTRRAGVLLSLWTGQCCRGAQISGQLLISQNKHGMPQAIHKGSHRHPPSSGAHSGAVSLGVIMPAKLPLRHTWEQQTLSIKVHPPFLELQPSPPSRPSGHRHHGVTRHLALALGLVQAPCGSTCFVCGISSSFLGSFAYELGYLRYKERLRLLATAGNHSAIRLTENLRFFDILPSLRPNTLLPNTLANMKILK